MSVVERPGEEFRDTSTGPRQLESITSISPKAIQDSHTRLKTGTWEYGRQSASCCTSLGLTMLCYVRPRLNFDDKQTAWPALGCVPKAQMQGSCVSPAKGLDRIQLLKIRTETQGLSPLHSNHFL